MPAPWAGREFGLFVAPAAAQHMCPDHRGICVGCPPNETAGSAYA